jgi:hypothetical protein
MNPLARKEKLTIREMPDETLVYDLERHAMHCLNRTAALVWKHCDGRHDAVALAALVAGQLGLPTEEAEAAAGLALEQLGRRKLLQDGVAPVEGANRLSRRSALRKMAVAAAAAIPLVMTLKSPSVAWAQGGTFTPCRTFTDCPTGSICIGGGGPHLSQAGICVSFTTTTTTTTTTTRAPCGTQGMACTGGPQQGSCCAGCFCLGGACSC